MTLALTAIYAAPLGLLAIGLSTSVTLLRAKTKILIGEGGDDALLLGIRRHGNFIETVPLALILMLLAELGGGWTVLIHIAGVALLAGRVFHMIGLSGESISFLRGAGSMLTNLSVVTSIAMIVLAAAS